MKTLRAPQRARSARRVRPSQAPSSETVVLKLGGELIETRDKLSIIGKAIASAGRKRRLVVVHGGGREIDAALAQVGIPKRQIDGLRVTDEATLNVVVSVLAGSINTNLVTAINAAGGKAVGLSGADAQVAMVKRAPLHKSANGEIVDLGLVGVPSTTAAPALVATLCDAGYVPVVACIGAARDGQLFNVNADTLAGSLAARLKAKRLVIAGATRGVLDAGGQTIGRLDSKAIALLIVSGTASAGMVAKLMACALALKGGTRTVAIADGRDAAHLLKVVAGRKTDAATEVVK